VLWILFHGSLFFQLGFLFHYGSVSVGVNVQEFIHFFLVYKLLVCSFFQLSLFMYFISVVPVVIVLFLHMILFLKSSLYVVKYLTILSFWKSSLFHWLLVYFNLNFVYFFYFYYFLPITAFGCCFFLIFLVPQITFWLFIWKNLLCDVGMC
jgi:hypothetical protein